MDLYIVRFVRAGAQPDEAYCYHDLEQARVHLKLFEDDDSGLYRRIELVSYAGELLEVLG